MKVCPKCARSFDESFSFCLEDGTMLLSSTAPGETQRISTKSAAKTEIFPAKFQNLENSNPKKQGEKNGWRTAFLIFPYNDRCGYTRRSCSGFFIFQSAVAR